MSELIIKHKSYIVEREIPKYIADLFRRTTSIDKFYKTIIFDTGIILTEEVIGNSYFDTEIKNFIIVK